MESSYCNNSDRKVEVVWGQDGRGGGGGKGSNSISILKVELAELLSDWMWSVRERRRRTQGDLEGVRS